MITIKLSEAQKSAVECRDWSEEPIMRDAWDGGYRLVVEPEYASQLLNEVIDASNAEDAFCHERNHDREMVKYAARAARSLSTLADRIIRSAGNP